MSSFWGYRRSCFQGIQKAAVLGDTKAASFWHAKAAVFWAYWDIKTTVFTGQEYTKAAILRRYKIK